MLTIDLTHKDVTSPGLYIMKLGGRTGLVRIVGDPHKGWLMIQPENAPETYMANLPKDGKIPKEAFLSEPLQLVAS